MSLTRNAMPVQDAKVRAHNFDEVALGYTEEQAIDEANRCLNCKNMPCVSGCPVNIRIPDFIQLIKDKNFEKKTSLIEITIIEGRNHIIKKVFENLGYLVDKLTRVEYAFLNVDKLKSGEYRSLTIKEVKKLYEYKN